MTQQEAARDNQLIAEQVRPSIGIVTALPKEFAAVKALLINPMEFNLEGRGAGLRYVAGEAPGANGTLHVVVLALAGMGTNIAAVRAAQILNHFSSINELIMVGIAGGVPYPEKPSDHVRLGDIVVSDQKGVIHYEFDKETSTAIEYRFSPRPPSSLLFEGVNFLRIAEAESRRPWLQYIAEATTRLNWYRPPARTDFLANPLESSKRIRHPRDSNRRENEPRIFFGPIASANTLLKNPIKRNMLRDLFGVKAVEMEGSGIADATWYHEVGYLVVRGICDYCDKNKGDRWQEYAAVVAAAYTRALLESIVGSGQKQIDRNAITKPTPSSVPTADPTDIVGVVRSLLMEAQNKMQEAYTTFRESRNILPETCDSTRDSLIEIQDSIKLLNGLLGIQDNFDRDLISLSSSFMTLRPKLDHELGDLIAHIERFRDISRHPPEYTNQYRITIKLRFESVIRLLKQINI